MQFRYAFDDAVAYMCRVWADPGSAPVLVAVGCIATVAMVLVRIGMH